MQKFWTTAVEQEAGKIQTVIPLGGGDTSAVYRVDGKEKTVLVKTNAAIQLKGLLAAEHRGLVALKTAATIAIPTVYFHRDTPQGELLVMEYIPNGPSSAAALRLLGQQLANMHQQYGAEHGWRHDNFIGQLKQWNTPNERWPLFYAHQRLLPQLKLAVDKGLLHPRHLLHEDKLGKRCEELLGFPNPSPLHGDLWNGNYLISQSGQAYLIDPSFYYGHAEVDLAMARLFGGFGDQFYAAYHEIKPSTAGANERCEIYQLYYLLVHLNMFGVAYLAQVQRILQRYFA